MNRHTWRLPDGIDEVLPPDAWALERLRRRVLDLFATWGYRYVEPPLVEYLDSLLVGSGNDLELQTFRMVDQRSGRMLGIRADMTSQAARIDAASLRGDGPERLCYAGTVVHANPAGVLESRVPLLAGAELFGAADVEADAEVVSLMVDTLRCAGIDDPVIELGHVGLFRGLARIGKFDRALEEAIFGALQRKAKPDLEELLARAQPTPSRVVARAILALPDLLGDVGVIEHARGLFAKLPADIRAPLDELQALAGAVAERCEHLTLRFDLCELTGYGYHTGPVFAAYSANFGRAVARGGRYDGVGVAFGRARPATGFDVDLKRLPRPVESAHGAVWAPGLRWVEPKRRASLWQVIRELRANGELVIGALDEREGASDRCDRELVWQKNAWCVQARKRPR
ncbi:MAG TPA: ATP phosphoribosyltransferase regulatory subunit [Pseudomonadales bacterium]|nr:ATP phosphoribosyltransferase regulatory subunit [Pseudomonadales bacterium]